MLVKDVQIGFFRKLGDLLMCFTLGYFCVCV